MANIESMRQRRLKAAHAAAKGEAIEASGAAAVLTRRSVSFERPKQRAKLGGAAPPTRPRQLSTGLQERLHAITPVVNAVLNTTAKVCDWAKEACRIERGDDHEYGAPDAALEMAPPASSTEANPWQSAYVQTSSVHCECGPCNRHVTAM